jgi:broad specificity phosphatase PhoE
MRQNWPARLWLVRHGQSQGNVARDAADEAGHHEIDIDVRDVDVPLSELGGKQAEAAGRWFAALPPDERPYIQRARRSEQPDALGDPSSTSS